jgi:hypothetical protein
MNPQTTSKTEEFNHSVLLPSLATIQEHLEERDYSVLFSSATTLDNEPALEFLKQMCPDIPLHTSTNPQQWVDHFLCVETETIQVETNQVASLTERYCLAFQFTETSPGHIGITPISAYSHSWADFSFLQIHLFSENPSPKNIQEIDQNEIIDYFLESFGRFESYAPELEPFPLEPSPTPLESIEPPPNPPEQIDIEPEEPELPIPDPFNLAQRVQELTQQLSTPQFPTASRLNPNLPTRTQISPIKDRYDRINNLILEYSPHITEAELVEHLSRLSHYQKLKEYTFHHGHLIPAIEVWFKQYGQPRPDAIGLHLYQIITDYRKHLYSRLETLLKTNLEGVTAQSLHQELMELQQTHQYQKTLLERLEKSPLWGYLDASILTHTEAFQRQYPQILQSLKSDNPQLQKLLTPPESNPKGEWVQFLTHYYLSFDADRYTLHPIPKNNPLLVVSQAENGQYLLTESSLNPDFPARYLSHKDGKPLLKLIEPEGSEKYNTYRKHHPSPIEQDIFVEYTITQKLYPKRPVFIRNGSACLPRIERWWCSADKTTLTPNPFAQIWCIHGMLRNHLPQWLIIAATTGSQPLNTITLERGLSAAEGTAAYLGRSLEVMMQCEDEETQQLGHLLTEALGRGSVKYSHIHQEWNLKTNEPADILQLQFQMSVDPEKKSVFGASLIEEI